MTTKYTHPKDCPDHKDAATDRKTNEAARLEREVRQQALAHQEWFEWYAASPKR